MIRLHWRHLIPRAAGLALITLACDAGKGAEPSSPVKASEWIDLVNWSEAAVVTVNMVEAGSALAFSPSQLTFEAGKPYILRIVNPASNASKHYFSPAGLRSFYQAVATRKVQTSQAEYKAPYVDAVELMIGGSWEMYFVPVLAGTYDVVCTIPGHEQAGMKGQVTITGGAGFELDLEVATDFDAALASDGRRSSSHAVWAAAADTTVRVVEQPSYAFVPENLTLTKDAGYRIRLQSASGNAEKHYWTAADFFKTAVTRKVEDSQAELKVPYLKAVELMVGGQTQLFMVPTRAGTFGAKCTIPGHAEAGMVGTVVVSAN